MIFYTNILFINAQDSDALISESDGCDMPAFSSDIINYNAYDKVSFKNVIYECKPPPDDARCSTDGYEPGVGLSWDVAWKVTGPCSAEEEGSDTTEEGDDNDESNHFFCGLDWGDVSNDCDAVQHCPSGNDDACELPGAVCFGGTTCDASKGGGKYFEYLGLAYEDNRNKLFCASSYADASSSCSIDQWCKDGMCPDGLSCFGGLDCNIQDLIRADLEAEQEAAEANGETNEDNGDIDNEEVNPTIEEDIESNHFYCGLDWNVVASDCSSAQHCPSGTDDECELKGAICFGGTECDAAKGHGELFQYLGLPYEDARNRLFCASTWMEADSNCSVEYWCRDGMCADGMSCFGGLDCNIQDLIEAELEKEKEANGEAGGDDVKFSLDINDPKRNNFCGMTWGDASAQCGVWCGGGVECSHGQSCFADTTCFYDKDIVPSASPTITYDRAENMSFCGTGWVDAMQCTVERHCPNGDEDCQPSETCFNYIPGCNIVDLTKDEKPAPPTSMTPSRQPTDRPVSPAPVFPIEWTDIDKDEEVVSTIITPNPTNAPVKWIMEWIDIDKDEEEENWSEPELEERKLFCGETHAAATRNCGRNGYDCRPDGTCLNGLKCFVVTGICNDGEGSNENDEQQKEEEEEVMTYSDSPISSPTALANDIADTFFCGVDRNDASAACHKRCRTGSPGECPGGETCFGYISCSSETPRSPPTRNPTQKPTARPVLNMGVQQNYCAKTRAALETSCVNAVTCNTGDPLCPMGTFCWGDHLCSGVKTTRVPTYMPTYTPTVPPQTPPEAKVTTNPPISTRMPAYARIPSGPTSAPKIKATMNPTPIPTKMTATPLPTRRADTPVPTKMPTKRPIAVPAKLDANKPQGKSEPGTPDLLCASSMPELEASCASAPSCASGPCPKGQFCFPFTTCEYTVKDEPTSSNGEPFYCAIDMAELDERCGLATECTGNGEDCPKGQSCLRYDCKQSLDRCPLNHIGWHSSQDCNDYYICSNGVAGDTKICGESLKFDKVRELCVSEDLVDQYCYGLPLTETEEEDRRGAFYCATSRTELDERCGLATKCTGNGEACPEGQSCLPYDCKQSLDRCPLNFIGSRSSQDCNNYYKCSNGVAGDIKMCGESLKFDKVRVLCVSEDLVDQSCYGPPLTDAEKLEMGTCPKGYVGWQSSYGDCKEYHECRIDGSTGPTHVCREGMKFDKVRSICFDEEFVNDFCYGPALVVDTSNGDADDGYTLENDKSSGGNAGNPYQTGTSDHGDADDGHTLENDKSAGETAGNPYQAGISNVDVNASEIDTSFGETHSSTAGNPSSTPPVQPQMAPTPEVSSSTSLPTFGRGPISPSEGGDDFRDDTSRSKTASPTFNNVPPWYLHTTVDPNGGVRAVMQFMNTYTWLLTLASIQWMFNS